MLHPTSTLENAARASLRNARSCSKLSTFRKPRPLIKACDHDLGSKTQACECHRGSKASLRFLLPYRYHEETNGRQRSRETQAQHSQYYFSPTPAVLPSTNAAVSRRAPSTLDSRFCSRCISYLSFTPKCICMTRLDAVAPPTLKSALHLPIHLLLLLMMFLSSH